MTNPQPFNKTIFDKPLHEIGSKVELGNKVDYKKPIQTARKAFADKGQEVGDELDKKYIIPKEKIQVIILHYAHLMRNNPHMKVHRIVRKVAEYFKLQPKPNES